MSSRQTLTTAGCRWPKTRTGWCTGCSDLPGLELRPRCCTTLFYSAVGAPACTCLAACVVWG